MSASRPNACVFAGAGTGKTHGLITECLRLLGGPDRDEPLAPARLCLLTFTEKAAAEMRGRLGARVAALAAGEASEPELAAAFAAAGRPFPPVAEWRRLQSRLSGATIATFHGFCAGLLRRAPAGSGTPPDFVLLDEEESLDLLEELAERLVLERLEAVDSRVEALCGELDLRGLRRSGLVELLVDQARRVRDHGHAPDRLAVTGAEDLARAFAGSGARARAAVDDALLRARAEGAECEPVLAAIGDLLVGWSPETALERAARLADLREALPGRGGKNGLGAAVRAARDALSGGDSPLGAAALLLARPHEETWRGLLVELARRQRTAFDEAGALDFAELLIRARDLLATDPGVRAREQSRIGALLLDEFQDTNVLQLELTFLLAEARDGAPRPLGPEGHRGLPLEPGFLCAVGDRKQSIYDFRGADVEVFEELARAVEAGGGERRFLRVSRRAQPELVSALNGIVGPILGQAPSAPWEVPFRPGEDDLQPWRPRHGPRECVERLVALAPDDRADERRQAEADLLARRLALLLVDPEVSIPEGSGSRPIRGGDVAILLRSFMEVSHYTEALARHQVPHRVLRGRGIFASPEVRDVAALLGFLTDPRNPLHLAACLRGPAVGLSDATLVRLAVAHGRLDARVLAGALPAEALPGEPERVARFVSVARRLRSSLDRRSLVDLLEDAWGALGTRVALAASPHGEEQLANLDLVRQLAARWDARGRPDAAAFARRLMELADRDPRIDLEEVEDARSGPAVQLLTVHAAKGLEWPVVCIADLGASRPPTGGGRLLVDPRNGLAFRPSVPWSAEPHPTPRSAALSDVLASRDLAESRRVLYVALTRARDRLVLSGIQGRGGQRTWASWIDPLLDAPEVRPRIRRLDDQACPALPASAPSAHVPADPEQVRRALRRLDPMPVPALASVPLEALHALEGCARRFQLRFLEGHREPGLGAAPASASPRHRDGRLAAVRQLVAGVPPEGWRVGVPDDALAPAAGRVGLTLAEVEALQLARPLRRLSRALRGFTSGFSWASGVRFAVPLGDASVHGAFDLLLAGAPGDAAVCLVPGIHAGSPASVTVVLEALRARTAAGRQVRAAVLGVDGEEERLGWVSDVRLGLAEVEARLRSALGLGPELAEPLDRRGCEALGCGFVRRCHPEGRGL